MMMNMIKFHKNTIYTFLFANPSFTFSAISIFLFIVQYILLVNNLNLQFLDSYYLMDSHSWDNMNNMYGFNNQGENSSNPQPNNSGNNTALPYDTQEDRDSLRKWMFKKLYDHRMSKANSVPYDTSLDDKFTPQEHEFICDQIVKHEREHVTPGLRPFSYNIQGSYPDRVYKGKVGWQLIEIFRNK